MNITVQREPLTPQSTPGKMSLDGVFECYTLEPRNKIYAPMIGGVAQKPYAIPAGSFFWRKVMSPEHGFEVVLIQGVPGFTGIEIHPGNIPKNTRGCTVVGTIQEQNFVGHSQEEFARLMAKLPDSGTIDYLDAPPVQQPDQSVQSNPQSSVG